jgi:alpha-L-rhamnosidase
MLPSGLLVDLHDCVGNTPTVSRRPRFSWLLDVSADWPPRDDARGSKPEPARGLRQSAYRIRCTEPSNGKLLADTGRVVSSRSTGVVIPGWAPRPGTAFSWQVMAWDQSGNPTPWSPVGSCHVDPAPLPKAVSPRDRLVVRQDSPVATVSIAPGHDFLDFGRALFGNVEIVGEPGERLIVRLGEKRAGNRVDPKPGRNVRFHEEHVEIGQDGMATLRLRPADQRRMPADIGPVMPFRYAEVERSRPNARVAMRRRLVTVPFDSKNSSFSSSDPVLDSIWKLCKDTMEATSFCGVYVDGDRERLPYEADAYINMLGHYAVDRSYATARHSHELLLFEPTWPTEWILFSVLMAWQDFWHTGDSSSLERHARVLDAKSLRRIARQDGLISTVQPAVPRSVLDSIFRAEPIRDNVDWPPGERDGYEMLPVNTVMNAFFLEALATLAKIFDVLGRPADSVAVQAHRDRALSSFQSVFFDPAKGRYVDGEGSRHASLHASLFALAFDLVPAEKRSVVADFVVSKGMACSVYAAQFLVDALYRSGRADAGFALLTSRGERSWAHMVVDVGTTIALEAWDDKFKPNQDWNHAWGAAPANLIPRWVAGVEVAKPGAEAVRIAPQPGPLARFDALVPTIRGGVRVRFERDGADHRFLVRLPANTDGAFVVMARPGMVVDSVRVDGQLLAENNSRREVPLLPGVSHRIVVRYRSA